MRSCESKQNSPAKLVPRLRGELRSGIAESAAVYCPELRCSMRSSSSSLRRMVSCPERILCRVTMAQIPAASGISQKVARIPMMKISGTPIPNIQISVLRYGLFPRIRATRLTLSWFPDQVSHPQLLGPPISSVGAVCDRAQFVGTEPCMVSYRNIVRGHRPRLQWAQHIRFYLLSRTYTAPPPPSHRRADVYAITWRLIRRVHSHFWMFSFSTE